VVGSDAHRAAEALPGPGRVRVMECDVSLPAIARLVAPLVLETDMLVVPASPDGRDIAPLLGLLLRRPLVTGVTKVVCEGTSWIVTAVRSDGLLDHHTSVDGSAVVTLIPGQTGQTASFGSVQIDVVDSDSVEVAGNDLIPVQSAGQSAVQCVVVLPADPATMDLTEAHCIVAGGQGIAGKDRFDQLGRIGTVIGGSLGGTRVASDAGWIPFERQIGTTGVTVNPQVYLAFGISGATQHTSGLGSPEHIVSVNTDPSCPMMTMSDVAIVADAKAVLESLESKLRERSA
jgi:electron transfer flavoprotein alpha subunit